MNIYLCGGFHKWGYPQWQILVNLDENWGTPILGNPHILIVHSGTTLNACLNGSCDSGVSFDSFVPCCRM